MTDAEKFNRFNVKFNNLNQTLQAIFQRPGISLDLLDRASQAQTDLSQIQTAAHTKWNSVAQGNRQHQTTNTFDSDIVALENLHPQIRDLHTESVEQAALLRDVSQTIEIDKNEFKNSLDYHKRLAKFTFAAVLTVVGLALISLASLFGLIEWLEPKSTQRILDFLRTEKEFNYKVSVELILLMGGRFSLIIAFAWLVGFLGRLHNSHTRQAIYYQDKIAGLEAAKLIISAAKTTSREKIVSDMATTYLALSKNAFEKPVSTKTEKLSLRETIALRILERLTPRLTK